MVDASVALVAVLLWVAAVVKGAALANVRTAPHVVLVAIFVALAIAATLFAPAFNAAIGGPRLGTTAVDAVARSAVIVAAAGAQILLLLLTDEAESAVRRSLRRGAIAGVTLILLWALLLATPGDDYLARGVDAPSDGLFLVVFLAYLAYALADVIRSVLRWAPSATGPLRMGLQLIGIGCVSGLVYVAVKAAAVAGPLVGLPMPLAVEAASGRSFAVLGGALVTLGSAVPALAARMSRAAQWCRRYRLHARLYSLWADLVSVAPGIALSPRRSRLRDLLLLDDLDVRLYRRVIEIRDGRLAVRPFLDAALDVGPITFVSLVPDRDASREALALRCAVAAALAGTPPARVATGRGPEGDSFEQELWWWEHVARRYPARIDVMTDRNQEATA